MEHDEIKERCISAAKYITSKQATVRQTAIALGISKSTVHKDMTERLGDYDFTLYEEVKEILEKNKEERHLRGGEATRRKYLKKKEMS